MRLGDDKVRECFVEGVVLGGDEVVLDALCCGVRDGKGAREGLAEAYEEGARGLPCEGDVDIIFAGKAVYEALPPEPEDGPLMADSVEGCAVPRPESVELTLVDNGLSSKELFVEVNEVEFREGAVRACGLGLLCGAEEVGLEGVGELWPGDLVLVEEGVALEHCACSAAPLVFVGDNDERCC